MKVGLASEYKLRTSDFKYTPEISLKLSGKIGTVSEVLKMLSGFFGHTPISKIKKSQLVAAFSVIYEAEFKERITRAICLM